MHGALGEEIGFFPILYGALGEEIGFFPILYVAVSGEHALLLEGFCHLHMTVNHPQLRLDLPSDDNSDLGREKYDRKASDILVNFLEFGAARTIEQIGVSFRVPRKGVEKDYYNPKGPST